jgi:hypothetical protein
LLFTGPLFPTSDPNPPALLPDQTQQGSLAAAHVALDVERDLNPRDSLRRDRNDLRSQESGADA